MNPETYNAETLSALEPREAAAWFIARRAEGLSARDQELLANWLQRDAAHQRLFDSADRAWQSFDESEDDEILTAMRAHALSARPQRHWARWQAAAAAACLLVVAGSMLLFIPRQNPSEQQAAQPNPAAVSTVDYESARAEVRELSLPDGSGMTLDADSAAHGQFSATSRQVQLRKGRAYFTVQPDRTRPFTVNAADRSIVAVGTRFDVNLTADGVVVTLLEGRVQISSQESGATPLTLEPGQQYAVRAGRASIQGIGAAGDNAIAWRQGLIAFDDQTLAEAITIMNRYSSDQIVINDPGVASLRVSGQFRAGNPERFAQTVADMHKLRSVRRADQIELERPSE